MADTGRMLDVGQANELKLAFRRAGYTNAEIKKLSEGDLLADLLPLIRAYGKPMVAMSQHLIDCDAVPMIPKGLHIEEKDQLAGRVRGQITFDPTKITLYLSEKQQNGRIIEGHKFLKELANKAVYTANVLDYLLAHQELIPESWKDKAVFFFGTVYRDLDGGLYVRYLVWDGKQWYSDYGWLDDGWSSNGPAALHASV
ncbi:MAG: hypothetical protein AAB378_01150 [Patescibacteria group bacterium]